MKCLSGALLIVLAGAVAMAAPALPAGLTPVAHPIQEGFVEAHGVFLYYETIGSGPPLVVLHGGPGASHEYLMPYLVPLARHHRLVFIDERGSGKSTTLEDPEGYTVEAMVEDVEAVRQALNLGRIDLLGHSYGGVLAQAYALKYPDRLSHLVLCSTFYSTREINRVLARIKQHMPPAARRRLERLEAAGVYGTGEPWEHGRYSQEYEKLAWGDGYYPYLYRNHPDPTYDPTVAPVAWTLYRQMWGSHGEFVIDGNLKSVEYADRLPSIHVPTLITAGDHDQVDPATAREMQALIPGARLAIFPNSGHMTFVDQPALFLLAVDTFLRNGAVDSGQRSSR